MNYDEIDLKIIELLKENSKRSLKEIGELTHLTGQAVGMRVNRLIDEGIIKNYTIKVNEDKLGPKMTAFIKIYMKNLLHDNIQKLFKNMPQIIEAYKTGSEACYMIKVSVENSEQLDNILLELVPYANYQIISVVKKIK